MSRMRYIALDSRVLAVAAEGDCNDWAAYIGSVPGVNHDNEVNDVVKHGSKLLRGLAEYLFPDFKHLRWRY